MTDNLTLWDQVRTPDPKYTKKFKKGGGFEGTATNATYLMRVATETFGPCGIGWGFDIVYEDIRDGHPLEGGFERVHVAKVRFWYVWQGKRGEVEHMGQTTFCGKRNSGIWYTDEDAPKKSITDALTKAMSLVGFAADIHLGLFDDNKYVNDVKRDFAEKAAALEESHDHETGEIEPVKKMSAYAARKDGVWDKLKSEMESALDPESLKLWALLAETKKRVSSMPDNWQTEFRELYHNRLGFLKSQMAMVP